MAPTPLRPCARCGTISRGPCAACAKLRAAARDARRASATERGYDQTWATFSKAWLERFPYCGQRADGRLYTDDSRCVQMVQRNRAECTDHIVALRDGGKKYAPSNLQSLCTACNLRKNIEREGGFGRPRSTRTTTE